MFTKFVVLPASIVFMAGGLLTSLSAVFGVVEPTPGITGWANLASSTSFGGLAWYLIAKAIPAIHETHHERIDAMETRNEARIQRLEQQYEKRLDEQRKVFDHALELLGGKQHE